VAGASKHGANLAWPGLEPPEFIDRGPSSVESPSSIGGQAEAWRDQLGGYASVGVSMLRRARGVS
jgi:hypothetical protein